VSRHILNEKLLVLWPGSPQSAHAVDRPFSIIDRVFFHENLFEEKETALHLKTDWLIE
jgi:hypothetical protein